MPIGKMIQIWRDQFRDETAEGHSPKESSRAVTPLRSIQFSPKKVGEAESLPHLFQILDAIRKEDSYYNGEEGVEGGSKKTLSLSTKNRSRKYSFGETEYTLEGVLRYFSRHLKDSPTPAQLLQIWKKSPRFCLDPDRP